MSSTTFSVNATDLHDALANVLPHTDKDNVLPVLCAVQVEVGADGTVLFVATDRYTLAVVEVVTHPDTDVVPGSFLMPAALAKDVAKMAKAVRYGDVTFTADDSAITAGTVESTLSGRIVDGQFPKWPALFPADVDPAATERIGLGAANLAKFAKLYRNGRALKRPTLDLTFRAANKPVDVKVPEVDGFKAIIMPVRLAS